MRRALGMQAIDITDTHSLARIEVQSIEPRLKKRYRRPWNCARQTPERGQV